MKAVIGVLTFVSLLAAACGGESGSPAERAGGADAPLEASSGQQPNAVQGEQDRKLVVTSNLKVEVDKLRGAYDQAAALAVSHGGFVADSTISEEGRNASATMRLRVPARRHDEVMTALRGLGGKVLKESTTAKEVTEEYTDLASRLRNLTANEAQYVQLLARAQNVNDVLSINQRLDTVRGDIEKTQGRINLLDSLVEFATVNLTMAVPAAAASEELPTPLEAFETAWEVSFVLLQVLANILMVLLVAAIWLVPLSTIGYVLWRQYRRYFPAAPS